MKSINIHIQNLMLQAPYYFFITIPSRLQNANNEDTRPSLVAFGPRFFFRGWLLVSHGTFRCQIRL